MVKKISALVLALVLCLSVVVVPASAGVELGDATFAIAFEWDKTSYQAGDTAILSLYADGADDLSFFTGAITFGLSSDVFDPADHTQAVLRENSTTAEWFEAYYQPGSNAIAPLASAIATKVTNANTAEEKELYDWYVKVGFAKNGSGWHENTSTTKNGFYGTDWNPDEPFMTIAFTVREDVADGTPVRAAITTGTLNQPSASAPSTYIKYFKNPGNATTTANVASSATAISQADTFMTTGDVVIGEAGPEYPDTSIVNPLKGQMRYGTDEDGVRDGTYDVRALAKISKADFEATFTDEATAKGMITEVGFVFAAGSNVAAPSMADVVDVIESCNDGDKKGDYTKKTVNYIARNFNADGDFAFSCIVTDISKDAAQTNSLVAVGYIAYTVNGETVYAYYPAPQTIDFATLYRA